MTTTAIWEPIPNSVIPQCWGYNLQWIRSQAGINSLREDSLYSLSFQKDQLNLYVNDYYLHKESRVLYKELRTYYAVDIEGYSYNSFNIFHSLIEFEDFITSNNGMYFCGSYAYSKLEIQTYLEKNPNSIISIGNKKCISTN